jgi:hypothetical protein
MEKKKTIKKKGILVKKKKVAEKSKEEIYHYFFKLLKNSHDRWVKSPSYPKDWKSGINKNRTENLLLLKSFDVPVDIEKLLTICIKKSIRLSQLNSDSIISRELSYDETQYDVGIFEEELGEYFEIIDNKHDDRDYKRYYHIDIIYFKEHDIYIREDSEGVYTKPPYELKYSLVTRKYRGNWI